MKRRISVEEIINYVCKRYGLESVALAEPGKKRNSSKARAMIAFAVWYEDHLSPTDPGRRLGL